jgi:hypothetical protein
MKLCEHLQTLLKADVLQAMLRINTVQRGIRQRDAASDVATQVKVRPPGIVEVDETLYQIGATAHIE